MKWTNTEIEILKNEYPLLGSHKLTNKLNRTNESILWKAKQLKLRVLDHVRKQHMSENRKDKGNFLINLNELLNIQKPEIAYVLGFLWADGCFRNQNYSITFSNLEKDIKEIIHILNIFGKWSYRKHISKSPMIHGRINGMTAYEYLCNLGYYNKSFQSADLILDKIPENLRMYWWRGYFDGDGHITKNKYKHYIVITSSKSQDWSFVKKLPVNGHITINTSKYGSSSQFRITKKEDTIIFLRYIYNNYEKDKIGFSRKYNMYKNKYLDINGCYKPKNIHYSTYNKRWLVTKMVNRKTINIGRFKTMEEAIIARNNYLIKNGAQKGDIDLLINT